MKNRDYRPTGISPHTQTGSRICWECGKRAKEREMEEQNPVPGLTVWVCCKGKNKEKLK